jgi:hypothetical protein
VKGGSLSTNNCSPTAMGNGQRAQASGAARSLEESAAALASPPPKPGAELQDMYLAMYLEVGRAVVAVVAVAAAVVAAAAVVGGLDGGPPWLAPWPAAMAVPPLLLAPTAACAPARP